MNRLLESINSKLEALRDGKLSQAEIDELVDEQKVLLQAVFFESPDGMMLVDEHAQCIGANQAQIDMLGYSYDELLQKKAWDWDAKFDQASIMKIIENDDNGGLRFESVHKRKDGTTFPVEVSTNAVWKNGEKFAFCICRDMTEAKQREELIRQLSITDGLTGLINRREFTRLLSQEIGRADRYEQMFSVLMYDLDYFKSINDGFGHDVGDEVLVQLTSMLQDEIRQTDVQSRWGGEEFMILLPGTHLNEAERFAEKLRLLVEKQEFTIAKRVTISIGVAEYRQGESIDLLLKRLDDALYRAKERGRNQVAAL